MITATCTNSACQWNGIDRWVTGEPPRVECGACHNDCELTDLRDDPPKPEPFDA